MAKKKNRRTPIYIGFHVPSHTSTEHALATISGATKMLLDDGTWKTMGINEGDEIVVAFTTPTSAHTPEFFQSLQSLLSVTKDFTPHFTQWTKEDTQ